MHLRKTHRHKLLCRLNRLTGEFEVFLGECWSSQHPRAVVELSGANAPLIQQHIPPQIRIPRLTRSRNLPLRQNVDAMIPRVVDDLVSRITQGELVKEVHANLLLCRVPTGIAEQGGEVKRYLRSLQKYLEVKGKLNFDREFGGW
jgi:hypothetical protein